MRKYYYALSSQMESGGVLTLSTVAPVHAHAREVVRVRVVLAPVKRRKGK